MRSRGDQLLDLCRRSRDLDRSLGLYRDVCDLSCSDLDCLSLLDRDCHSLRGGCPLLEYICASKTQAYRYQLAALAALEPAELGQWALKPLAAIPRVSHGPEAIRSNTNAHHRRAGTSSANVRDPKPLRSTGGAKELDYNTLLPVDADD